MQHEQDPAERLPIRQAPSAWVAKPLLLLRQQRLEIDEAAIWGRALSPAEVAQHAATGVGADSRPPLIFLPGLQGSRIERGGSELWPSVSLWADPWDLFLIGLRLDEAGSPPTPSEATDIIRSVGPFDFYSQTIETLEQHGYKEGENLFVFPYDWRLSAVTNAAGLLAKIEAVLAATEAERVDLLAHSQGGLVTRAALALPASVGKVRRVVTLGTPVYGAAKALGIVDFGTPCVRDLTIVPESIWVFDVPLVGGATVCLLDPDAVRAAVRNMPGLYELLPSRAYHETVGPPYFTGSPPVALAYDEWTDVVGNRRNPTIMDGAKAFHDWLDSRGAADPDVEIARVVGTGLPTIVAVREYLRNECAGSTCWPVLEGELVYGDGDQTVPQRAADLRWDGAKVAYIALKHMELAQSAATIGFAADFFDPPSPSGLSTFAAAASSVSSEPSHFTGYELETLGPVRGTVADAVGRRLGHVAGMPADAVVYELPNAYFETVHNTQSFLIADSGAFTGELTVQQAGSVRLRVRRYGDSAVQEQTVYQIPNAEPGAVLTIEFGAEEPQPVQIDEDGDGDTDATLPPIGSSSGAALGDFAPPSTEPLTGLPGVGGLVGVALGADDAGGAGAGAIFFQVGDGDFQLYEGPFEVLPGTRIRYYSIDKAGNVEDVRELVVDDAPSTRRGAAPIRDGDHVRLALDPQGDEDWFTFEADGASTYRAQLIGLTADYDLELYDADGALVAGPHLRSTASEQVQGALTAGRYYVRVCGFGGAWSATHDYQLKLQTLG